MLQKILVIDDSALIHQMYRMVLMRYQCQILAAYNGQDGLDKLVKNDGIDLILVDINMPVMNGLEFITNVMEIGTFVHIPIVIISTEGKDEDTLRGIELGAKAYLKKPFQPSDLHALIEQLCPAPRTMIGQGLLAGQG